MPTHETRSHQSDNAVKVKPKDVPFLEKTGKRPLDGKGSPRVVPSKHDGK